MASNSDPQAIANELESQLDHIKKVEREIHDLENKRNSYVAGRNELMKQLKEKVGARFRKKIWKVSKGFVLVEYKDNDKVSVEYLEDV